MVSSKWIYKIKHEANGSIEKYKEMFVVGGFSQKEGIDYEQTFAPVASNTSIITIVSFVQLLHNWHVLDLRDHTPKLLNWRMDLISFLLLWSLLELHTSMILV